MNRDIIDSISNRYFFVADPVRYDIEGAEIIDGKAPLHPDHPERGSREYRIEGSRTVFISSEDSKIFADKKQIRLKDLCNLEYGTPAKYAGNDLSVLKKGIKAVQWVGRNSIDAELLMPDGSIVKGSAEDSILREQSDTVQFERVGFVRLESRSGGIIRAVFTHR